MQAKRMSTIRAYARQTWSRNLRRGSVARVKLTEAQVAMARRLWSEGVHRDEVARRIGVSVTTFIARRGDQLADLERRAQGVGSKKPGGYVDPTPEEIAARCAEIQREWTTEERLQRLAGRGNILRVINLRR